MNERELKTPVLFIIFNRPNTTSIVFEQIRKAKPQKLFIAADGPRPERPDDADLCDQSREIVNQITWECEVKTLYRDTNVGCKKAVISAISWFFDNVEEGIILEDDCVPEPSFFPFCQLLLQYYRNDERVMMITGTNYLFNKITTKESYFFSTYFSPWGWATWRRAWKLFDINMVDWPKFMELRYLERLYPEAKIAKYLTSSFQRTYEGKVDTWDYQWCYSGIFNHGLCATPINNLISNIGKTGTHFTGDADILFMPKRDIDIANIIHPEHIFPNFNLDRLNFYMMLGQSDTNILKIIPYYILKRIRNTIKLLNITRRYSKLK